MFDLAVSLWVINISVIELDAQVFAPEFYLIGRKVHAVIGDDAVWDTIMVYGTGYKVYPWSDFGRFNWFGLYPLGEFIYHDQQIFFLMASPFKGSDHVKPPDRKRPSNGYSLEGGRWHVALVSK